MGFRELRVSFLYLLFSVHPTL